MPTEATDPPAPERANPPRFNTATMRSTDCQVVAVRATPDRMELHFGVLRAEDGARGARQVGAAHRIGLTRDAATRLEEVLGRLLDPTPADAVAAGTTGTEAS